MCYYKWLWCHIRLFVQIMKKQSHTMPAISQIMSPVNHPMVINSPSKNYNWIWFFLKRLPLNVICFHKISCSWQNRWYHPSWEWIASMSFKNWDQVVVSHPIGDGGQSGWRWFMEKFSQAYHIHNFLLLAKSVKMVGIGTATP